MLQHGAHPADPNLTAPARPDPAARMREFVERNGGTVRYDRFAEEHMHGELGFYTSYLDLRPGGRGIGEVPTPCRSSEAYRHHLAGLVVGGAVSRIGRSSPAEKPLTIVEVGGGAGELKRAVLLMGKEAELNLDFISVEPNPAHREAQQAPGTKVLAGTIHKIPVADGSVDVLFDEEVLDCIPQRVLRWDYERRRFTGELHVCVSGNGLASKFLPCDPQDRFLGHRAADLAAAEYRRQYYFYVPGYWDYLNESARVLKPGGMRISTDYGYVEPKSFHDLLYPDDLGHVEKAIEWPYQVDLTHWVDFAYLGKLAIIQRHFPKAMIRPLGELFHEAGGQALELMTQSIGRYAFIAVRS